MRVCACVCVCVRVRAYTGGILHVDRLNHKTVSSLIVVSKTEYHVHTDVNLVLI